MLGVVIRSSGEAEIVSSPVAPARASDVRAVARYDGTWRVVLAVAGPLKDVESRDRMSTYWSAITDGRVWRQVVKLPSVPGRLKTAYASALIETRDLAAIAVPLESTDSVKPGTIRTDVAVFERVHGQWTVHVVETKRVAYVAIAASPDGALVLGVVRNDSTLTADNNSFFMFEQDPGETTWRDLGRVIRGGTHPVHHPELAFVEDDVAVIYRVPSDLGESSRLAVRTRRGTTEQAISDHVEDVKQATLDGQLLGAASLLFGGNKPSSSRTLLVRRYKGAGFVTTDSVPTEFQSVTGITATADTLYATGPIQARSAQEPVVASYLYTAAWRCDPR